MTTILSQIIDCKTCREVDRVIENNILKVEKRNRNFICRFANVRKRNILQLERVKKESFKELLN